jgi:eukaryotic-like serine/threonine-protein kinase
VQVYEAGDVDGQSYFTMELVEGGSLAQQIQGVPQPVRKAAVLVATLADAVHAAHKSGIVHRDLKPGNVLLTADGTPKVTDFGLARHLQDGGELTLSGAPVGTPSYMAPEQAQGRKDAIGPATDVYALGATLYELLTGRPPFRAETATATLQQVLADEPVPPARLNSQVPRDLQTVCLKCLEKDPARRFASAAALADDLRRFERGEPIVAQPAGRLERAAKWARRRPAAAVLLAAGVLMFAGVTAAAV